MATVSTDEIYYDPFDIAIDKDPHPLWKRMRDDAPFYHNDKYGFWALSRFDDVEKALVDWDTYRSGRGSTLEFILANVEMPPGNILAEDPPIHDLHRGLLSRVFTPKKMAAIESKVRAFCAETLDPLVGAGGFDFIGDLGAYMPMRTIGMLLGIPEQDQEAIREHIDAALKLEEGGEPPDGAKHLTGIAAFGDYIDWRKDNPSDDLMTDLLVAEFEDEKGVTRTLTRGEVLTYVMLLAGAGNETTTRLIGWTGKLLAEHPEQRRAIVEDPGLLNNAIEEILRYEAPSPVQARVTSRPVEHYGVTLPEGTIVLLLNGSANRDDRHFEDADRFDIRRRIDHHLSFGYGIHFCLGAALARLEGRVALDEVLKRFPEWDVDWANAKQAHTAHVRGWERLPVVTAS
jgi:cytochrome P450